MKKNSSLILFFYLFILSSCGGGGSPPFSLTLPMLSTISINEDNPYTSTISATTNYKSQITYEITYSTTNGESNLTTSGLYNYEPNQDYFGADSFTIKVTAQRLDDNNITTGETLIKNMTIAININPVNDPPVINIIDELSAYSDTSLIINDVLNIKVEIIDVDNELSELTFFGRLPNENINAQLDIISIPSGDEFIEEQSLDFYVDSIQTAGLFNMNICANDGTDLTCEGDLEAYFISDKDVQTISYNCDEDELNCLSTEQYLYYLVGSSETTAKTDYIFIADQINDTSDRDEFHLRLLESVNNLKNSDASEMFNDYFNIRVLEETNPSGASLFNIETGCYASWDERIY